MGYGWMRKEMPSSVSLGRAECNTSIGSLEFLRTRKPMLRAKCLQLYGSKRQNCGHLYLKGSLPFHFPHLVQRFSKRCTSNFCFRGLRDGVHPLQDRPFFGHKRVARIFFISLGKNVIHSLFLVLMSTVRKKRFTYPSIKHDSCFNI